MRVKSHMMITGDAALSVGAAVACHVSGLKGAILFQQGGRRGEQTSAQRQMDDKD